jgi:hypothetical protein
MNIRYIKFFVLTFLSCVLSSLSMGVGCITLLSKQQDNNVILSTNQLFLSYYEILLNIVCEIVIYNNTILLCRAT